MDKRATLVDSIRSRVIDHINDLNLDVHVNNNSTKDQIRANHRLQKLENIAREKKYIGNRIGPLIKMFAVGDDIVPERIDPEIIPVIRETDNALLFRMVTTLSSVAGVGSGCGRRMRFLVKDRSNNKLIGILGLCDAVLNLRVRDELIGWTWEQRKERLINMMNAYCIIPAPPYAQLLGGKLITSLIGSSEVSDFFKQRYSNRKNNPRLALVTTTSALGRSSMYNRVKLPGLVELRRIGETVGYGRFHISDEILTDMRKLLVIDGCKVGTGPIQKPMNEIAKALTLVGLNWREVQRHGIKREVYVMPLAENWREFLRGETDVCESNRPSVDTISKACLERWMIPRSIRRPEFRDWSCEDREKLFEPILTQPVLL